MDEVIKFWCRSIGYDEFPSDFDFKKLLANEQQRKIIEHLVKVVKPKNDTQKFRNEQVDFYRRQILKKKEELKNLQNRADLNEIRLLNSIRNHKSNDQKQNDARLRNFLLDNRSQQTTNDIKTINKHVAVFDTLKEKKDQINDRADDVKKNFDDQQRRILKFSSCPQNSPSFIVHENIYDFERALVERFVEFRRKEISWLSKEAEFVSMKKVYEDKICQRYCEQVLVLADEVEESCRLWLTNYLDYWAKSRSLEEFQNMDQLLKVEKSKVSSKDLLIRKKTQLIDQNLKILAHERKTVELFMKNLEMSTTTVLSSLENIFGKLVDVHRSVDGLKFILTKNCFPTVVSEQVSFIQSTNSVLIWQFSRHHTKEKRQNVYNLVSLNFDFFFKVEKFLRTENENRERKLNKILFQKWRKLGENLSVIVSSSILKDSISFRDKFVFECVQIENQRPLLLMKFDEIHILLDIIKKKTEESQRINEFLSRTV